MQIIKSSYFNRFRCIADKCPDSCCKEWDVQVDAASAAFYRQLPGDLGDRLRQVLKDEDGQTYMTIENRRCPMWRGDGLCRIQAELGEQALCKTCREYPRLTHDYGDFLEMGLELSCPEAAKLILTAPPADLLVQEVAGGSAPEYDRDAMVALLRTRKEALALLDTPNVGKALALVLLFGYHAQAQVDGEKYTAFDPDAALDAAKEFTKPTEAICLPRFYASLEILTDTWRSRLAAPAPAAWSEPIRALARYGIERYWLQAVCDYDLVSRVKMIVAACLLVKILGGDPVTTAQLYSKEIENSAENVDAILDAAYENPAFTDDKLLWLLMED